MRGEENIRGNGGIEKRICRQRIFLLIYKTRNRQSERVASDGGRKGGMGESFDVAQDEVPARPAVILKNRFAIFECTPPF